MHNRIKIIFSLFLVFISLSPFAQNKKQQIESLIIKNDSLLELVSKERKITFIIDEMDRVTPELAIENLRKIIYFMTTIL